eukprot:CAMPEP_0202423216 /NCGR_PEP_ID=MMETSP1128-20130828/51264_1 /ASSEMBLY_ACC=CAM_ASM_000463 /TAXON_ID=3047 /ORGANISM="Dunaliella tertiolecta, Strain CCMP1320" /LENGTH=136 /DNA_ID=CAMNT_0049031311 /DNA_START=1593 /DNA_END=2001 /DNA_ORIENTATION=-
MKIEETKQLRTGATQACKLRMPSGNQSRANRGVAKMEPLPHGKANDADKSPSRKDVTQLVTADRSSKGQPQLIVRIATDASSLLSKATTSKGKWKMTHWLTESLSSSLNSQCRTNAQMGWGNNKQGRRKCTVGNSR